MTVSTKNPANRAGGATPSSTPGPIPAPRVVNKRRIRTGSVALAVMLLALGAALSGIALVSATRTSSYLAVARPVAVGAKIAPEDLVIVQLSGGAGLIDPISAASLNAVIGKRASVVLLPGTLLVGADLAATPTPLPAGFAEIPMIVRSASLPSPTLSAGDVIHLVPQTPAAINLAGAGHEFAVTIADIAAPDGSGNVSMHLIVNTNDLQVILQLNAGGGLAVVLETD